MTESKLCRDCKHLVIVEVEPYGNKFMCHAVNINSVDGRSSPEPCTDIRAEGERCGTEGTLFKSAHNKSNGDILQRIVEQQTPNWLDEDSYKRTMERMKLAAIQYASEIR